ncbi:hypothetical protein COW86_03545 [Candidatus Kuenenbacteria bacterium CG22_combo_CG10-13_8_21_14_all_39_9]|uniref:GON domain-containing protein n=1 Tax=Candidatus Kuenenbacteria bacterium CG22_combo_CG10-13_8_21_14_all_39_9 TaxID=1974621 RepID=A0A2H0D017_9BACT|nr:MAG: hypothetical protein COW86_03545 [Candidatus Kuenenbacteria bacterium CG22_combo_CG10-13_8_21_14_all_39_9]
MSFGRGHCFGYCQSCKILKNRGFWLRLLLLSVVTSNIHECCAKITHTNHFNNMTYIDLLGYAAGILVVISLLPQAVKSWKIKSTRDISLSRYVIYVMGLILWVIYAVIIQNGPVTVMI